MPEHLPHQMIYMSKRRLVPCELWIYLKKKKSFFCTIKIISFNYFFSFRREKNLRIVSPKKFLFSGVGWATDSRSFHIIYEKDFLKGNMILCTPNLQFEKQNRKTFCKRYKWGFQFELPFFSSSDLVIESIHVTLSILNPQKSSRKFY